MITFSTSSAEQNYKLVVLGYYSVGKSSLVMKYVRGEFNPHEESTIGAAFLTKSTTHKGKNIKYEIWDTAGQERYNSLIPMYYRGAQIALIVYDITCKESFETAKRWVDELSVEKPADFLKVLIGNKVDLEEVSRKISHEEGQEYAQSKGLMFFEASAKTGHNIDKIFAAIAENLPRKQESSQEPFISLQTGKKNFSCC